jgi:hypothetical protein
MKLTIKSIKYIVFEKFVRYKLKFSMYFLRKSNRLKISEFEFKVLKKNKINHNLMKDKKTGLKLLCKFFLVFLLQIKSTSTDFLFTTSFSSVLIKKY